MEVVKFRHRDIVQRFPSPCPLVMPCRCVSVDVYPGPEQE